MLYITGAWIFLLRTIRRDLNAWPGIILPISFGPIILYRCVQDEVHSPNSGSSFASPSFYLWKMYLRSHI